MKKLVLSFPFPITVRNKHGDSVTSVEATIDLTDQGIDLPSINVHIPDAWDLTEHQKARIHDAAQVAEDAVLTAFIRELTRVQMVEVAEPSP